VPFSDSNAMADETLRLLCNPVFQMETRQAAYEYAKPMFWPNVGRQYLDLFKRIASERAGNVQRLDRSVFGVPTGEGLRGKVLEARL